VYFILPDQQIRNFSRIVEATPHKPGRDDGHVLAVEPCPETEEMAVRPAPLFSLFHRLIPVTVLSSKVPIAGGIFKESVNVRTLKSPTSADDAPLNLSAPDVLTHRARTQTQYFGCLAERQQTLSDWRRVSIC
jgi:hypothetical protein